MTLKKTCSLALLSLLFVNCGGTPTMQSNTGTLLPSSPAPTSSEIKMAVERSNEIRADLYSNAPLRWNATLAQSAQNYANRLVNNGMFEHSGSRYGENLYFASFTSNYVNAINAWNSEVADYNFNTQTCKAGKVCGHYTQMIWKNSTQIGCGKGIYATGKHKGSTIVVCQYNPPGNYRGQAPF